MSVFKTKKSPYYQYSFDLSGVRFHGSTRETDKRRAEAIEKRTKEAAKKNANKARYGMTLNAAAGRYWLEIGQHKKKPDRIARVIERLIEFIGPDVLIAEIDNDRLAKLVAAYRAKPNERNPNKPISAGTVNRQLVQLLRRIMLRARKFWGVALPNEPDWSTHILTEPRERVRELRADEERRIEHVESEDYRRVRLFAQITGLRLREVATLTWSQLDFDLKVISVVGKGDLPHVVPITAELEALLSPLKGHHPELVFTFVAERTYRNVKAGRDYVAGERYPITYAGLSSRYRRAFAKADVKDFRWHDLRHTAATRIMRETGNLKLTSKLLGHASVTTTARYAHVDLEDVRAGMEAVAKRKNLTKITGKITGLNKKEDKKSS